MNTPPGFPNPPFPQGPPTGDQPLTSPPNLGTPVAGPPMAGPPMAGPPMAGPPVSGPPGSFGVPGSTPSWMPQTPEPQHNSSKTAYIALALVAVIGIGAVAFLLTRGDDPKTVQANVTIPTFTIPDFTIPDFTIPTITIPDFTIPTITVPTITVPEIPTTVAVATTVPVPPTTVVVAPTNLFAGTQAADVIAQFATARGAAPLRILQALFYPEYAFAQVQDPSIPVNVDEYQWRGTVSSPAPVTLTGDGDLESNLFSDTEVNWVAIPGLVEAALAQIPIEGAAVSHISVQRNLPFTADVQIRVFVTGTRGSGYLDADAQGNILEVSQS